MLIGLDWIFHTYSYCIKMDKVETNSKEIDFDQTGVKDRVDNIEHSLVNLENKIDHLTDLIDHLTKMVELSKNSGEKMSDHIDFIDGIYNQVRHPLNLICNKLRGGSSLPDKSVTLLNKPANCQHGVPSLICYDKTND